MERLCERLGSVLVRHGIYLLKGTLEPSSSITATGITVILDGANYMVFETGVPGIGFILGLKDYNGTTYVPMQTGITQSYPADGTNGYATALGWSAKVTFIKTGVPLKSGVYQTPTINAAILTAYNNEVKTAQVIINPTTITVTASGCTVGTKAPTSTRAPLMFTRCPA